MSGTRELERDNNVCIVGMGFVGLTLAVVMAERGFNVLGLEILLDKLEQLFAANVHFHEEGLYERCKAQLASKRLVFAHPDNVGSLDGYGVFILTVGTPLDDQGEPRMDMVERSARYIAEKMPDGALTILRSTVKLGTTREVVKPILDKTGKSFDLAYCSERTLEGRALAELATNPQIIGALNDESAARADQLFNRLTPKVVHVSSLEAAELIKLLDNSFRDYSFAFGNEVALICEAAGLNASEVISGANWEYERTNIPRPGFVGGPCLEKDPHILCSSLQPFGFTPRLIKMARTQNEQMPYHVVDLIENWMKRGKSKHPPVIQLCGLAFKGVPETDDIRGTPAKALINELKKRFPNVPLYAHDFVCSIEQMQELGLLVAPKLDVADVSIIIIVNDHPGYKNISKALEFKGKLELVVDCAGIYQQAEDLQEWGVDYIRFGDNG